MRHGEKVSYFLGAFHQQGLFEDLPAFVLDTLKQSKVAAFETDMDGLLKLGSSSEVPLSQVLSQKAWSEVVRVFKPWLSENEVNRLTAWQAARHMIALVEGATRLPHRDILDYRLFRAAQERQIKLHFLTSPLQHSRYVHVQGDAIGYLEETTELTPQPDFLRIIPGMARENLAPFVERVRSGDETLAVPEATSTNEEMDLLIIERHRLWLPQILKLVEDGSAFIAFGAAHLLGETGILTALKKRGFTVERYLPCEKSLLTRGSSLDLI